jgi:hypothetical protein
MQLKYEPRVGAMTMNRRVFVQSAAAAAVSGILRGQEPLVLLKAHAVTRGPRHHWFGYYDKYPWDSTGRYLLCQQNTFADRQPKPGEAITVGMVDLHKDDEFVPLATTTLWSWQQGTMLQWLGSDAGRSVIYNAMLDSGEPGAIIRDVFSGKTRALPLPIYAVNPQGTAAVGLDYARLHRLRPGYGYASMTEKHAAAKVPAEIVTLAQLAARQPKAEFAAAEHWVNHLQFSPGGTRVVFLHRWKQAADKGFRTRMYTVKPDGSELKILHDSNQISHFDWRDDDTVLAWVRLKEKEPRLAFALLYVDGRPPEVVFDGEKQDGHCSYSPDRRWVLNDTYPDKDRNQHLMLLNVKTGRRFNVNRFASPPAFVGPVRCDLHPRWNRDGTQVCFDGCHDAQRQVYVVDVREIVNTA